MNNIFVIGISHKTAPIHVREKVFLRPLEREFFLARLQNDPLISEAMVLSTCNRTEIYVNAVSGNFNAQSVIELLMSHKKIVGDKKLSQSFYSFDGDDCLRHLLRVITGLDSIVLGEKQILGQVKEAVDLSRSKKMFGAQFNIMMDVVVRAGKKTQRETDISCGGGSVSWAAVNTAQTIMGTLKDRSVLIIGAGKMSALAADQLANKQIGRLYVTNRTKDKAEALARKLGGESVLFMDLKEVLAKVDLCISCVSAAHHLIDLDLMQRIMVRRDHKKIVCVDISTPRTIAPEIRQIPNVELLTVDDLGQTLKENMDRRRSAVFLVEQIIEEKLNEFHRKMEKRKDLLPASRS